jgi:hypothetical protein
MSFIKWIEKNPLEAAALTAGTVATGGALAPAAAGAAGTGLTLGGAGAAAGMGGGTGLLAGATEGAAAIGGGTGLTGALPALTTPASGGFMASAAPYMQAMGAASQAKGLLSSPQQQAPQVSNHTDGGAGLSQLYGQIQQGDAQRMQEELAKRAKMQGLFGGGYGVA